MVLVNNNYFYFVAINLVYICIYLPVGRVF